MNTEKKKMKKIVNPKNGDYFLLLDNGTNYCEVLTSSLLKAEKENYLKSIKELDDLFSSKNNPVNTKRKEIEEKIITLQQRLDNNEQQMLELNKRLNKLAAENIKLQEKQAKGLIISSNFLMGIIFMAVLSLGILLFFK